MDTVEGMTPPDAVAGFHQAYMVILKSVLAFAQGQERSAQFDPVAFQDIPNQEEIGRAIDDAGRNLNPDTYGILSLAGCL
ncbi:hypothetical protein F4Y93_09020 [Candidatus Poribacteria bacterium]|nr:hypothetical protein [Candidatus Poribacteria bacterium]